uniref:Uncharacterized protein n=1 Tax=Anguilla anguilla TaxID=7936 RepID=A0A0E9X5M5_ANGAN
MIFPHYCISSNLHYFYIRFCAYLSLKMCSLILETLMRKKVFCNGISSWVQLWFSSVLAYCNYRILLRRTSPLILEGRSTLKKVLQSKINIYKYNQLGMYEGIFLQNEIVSN